MTNENDSNSPSSESKSQPPTQSPTTPAAPSESEVRADSDQVTESDKNTANELAREFRWVEFAKFAVNGALAIIGIIALFIYSGQLKEMRKATRATQTAAEAAKNSADAATASVDISRQVMESSGKQFRTEIRAYLSMVTARQSLSPIEGPTENQPYIRGQQGKYCVDVIYTNEGKTPVVGKRTTAHLILNDNPQPIVEALNVPPYQARYSDVMGTGDKFSTYCSELVDPSVLEKALKSEITVTVYGVQQYMDIFGEYHELGFCYQRGLTYVLFSTCSDPKAKGNPPYGNWFEKRPH